MIRAPMKCLALALLPLCHSIAIDGDRGRSLPEGSSGLPLANHRPGWLARNEKFGESPKKRIPLGMVVDPKMIVNFEKLRKG